MRSAPAWMVIMAAATGASGQLPPASIQWNRTQAPVLLGPGHSGAVLGLADLNADGRPDAVLSDNVKVEGSAREHTFTTLINRGDGTWTEPVATVVPTSKDLAGAAMALGDVDEDGVADLVTSLQFPAGGGSYNNISLLFGTPTGQFVNRVDLAGSWNYWVNANAVRNRAVALADANRDGHLDIITTTADAQLSVLPGDGRGHFGRPILSARTVSYDFLLTGDLDFDGYLDVVTLQDSGSQTVADTLIEVSLGNGDGTFIYAGTSHAPIRMTPTYDADPRAFLRYMHRDTLPGVGMSLVLFGDDAPDYGEGGILVMRPVWPGRFEAVFAESREEDDYRTQTIAVADVDGDGDYDIVKIPAPGRGEGEILLNDGTSVFPPVGSRLSFPETNGRWRATASADLVGTLDGANSALPDLLVVDIPDNPEGQSSAWCLGNSTPPPCPADYDGNGIVDETDFSLFANQWLATVVTNGTVGDFNGNGVTDTADVMDFMRVWFGALASGC